MFFNYLRTALYNLRNQPVFSAIKVLSLALGLACSILVVMHVQYVQSSNKHIENWRNTYRLITHLKSRESNTPYRTARTGEPYALQLKLDYGDQIQYIAKVRDFQNGFFSRGNGEIATNSYTYAESDAAHIFDLDLVQGDINTALTEPGSTILTQSVAQKYFANENPMGQTLIFNGFIDLHITGVIRDYPDNATHPMDLIISIETMRQLFGPGEMNSSRWLQFSGTQTFLTFNNRGAAEQLNDDLVNFVQRHLPESEARMGADVEFGLSLQPITDIYQNPLNNFGTPENSSRKTVLFGLVLFSILILVTSCINYINLTLAQTLQRRKEIGVRKTLGANSSDVIWQFLLESMLLTLIALAIALPIVGLVTPAYTTLTFTAFEFVDIFQTSVVGSLIVLVLFTGFVSGLFPSLSLANIQPAVIVKGASAQSRAGKVSRMVITVIQFAFSTTLILLAIAIYIQIEYLREMDIGFNKDYLVSIPDPIGSQSIDGAISATAMQNEMLQHPGVLSLASSVFQPPESGYSGQWRLSTSNPDSTASVVSGIFGVNFIETYGFELLAGRSFSEEFPADLLSPSSAADPNHTYGIVITDLLARRFGIDTPQAALDKVFVFNDVSFRVVGVIKRFQFFSGMETDASSTGILRGMTGSLGVLHVRFDEEQIASALAHIDATWAIHRPGLAIDRTFVSQSIDGVIVSRNAGLSIAALMASIITVGIAVCGLYALAHYYSARRTKEVGVRKVLGASSGSIVLLLVWDFIKPVILSCAIACPIAYYYIDLFYSGFSSQASFSAIIYVAVSLGVLLVSALTVLTQCYRTANSDPVHSLRYE